MGVPPTHLNLTRRKIKKMSEILLKRLKESEGKDIKIFLNNGFHYTGKCLGSDEKYVEILDYKINAIKILLVEDIKDMEVRE